MFLKNIASLSKKCDVFTRCFRFQKLHPETEIDKHGKLSVHQAKETSNASEGKITFMCLLVSMCRLVFLQLMCLCVSAITLVKLIRHLANVRHEFAMLRRKWWKCNCTVCSCVAFLRHASSCFLRLLDCYMLTQHYC